MAATVWLDTTHCRPNPRICMQQGLSIFMSCSYRLAQSTAGDFARASPCSNAIEPRKVQRQGPILAQIDALFNRRWMRAGVDECSKAKTRTTRGSSQGGAQARVGGQTQAGAARERGPKRHRAGHRRRVGERTGYFLNFHHLKPEAFSGFLR